MRGTARSAALAALVLLAAGCAEEEATRRLRGGAYARAGRHAEAIGEYRAVLRADPDDALTLTLLAQSEFELDRLGDAERHFRGALRADPDQADAHFGLGTLLARKGKERAAADAFERALEANARDLTVLLNLGNLYRSLGDDARARERFRAALGLDGESVGARFNLGLLDLFEGKYDDAEAHFRTLERSEPGEPFGPYGRAAVAAHRGNKDEALRLLRRALAKGIDDLEKVRRDEAFAPIREDPEFLGLLLR